uniref:BK channel n=1 Tax=Echinococcus granulosus TaxID=6210 RepID=A0A068WQI2_ECHGR|nr:potassium large conductance calcium activated [Echinococcus granulosus]
MNGSLTTADYRALARTCMGEHYWPYYVASIVATFFGGLLWILAYRVLVRSIAWFSKRRRIARFAHCGWHAGAKGGSGVGSSIFLDVPANTSQLSGLDQWDRRSNRCSNRDRTITVRFMQGYSTVCDCLRASAIRLLSYQYFTGRTFIALSMFLSLASFGIYVSEASQWPNEIEKCGHKGRTHRLLDFLFNLFFLLHFIIRWAAADNKLVFWVDPFSLLDYCTVPPCLLAFALQRSWMGLRFMRIFRLFNLAEVLHNLNIIKSASALRFCQLTSFFFAIWLAGAGMIFLLENTGDFFTSPPYDNSVRLTYGQCLYFAIVTMSTVGYGDITPQTALGRIFTSFFILCALAAFASCIPEIVEMFLASSKYSGAYASRPGRRHVVVCGDVTTESVKHFLDDFLHPDRRRTDVEVVFMNRSKPDLRLQSLLRRHFSRVKYLEGTVMSHVDLDRVNMSTADACLILANSRAVDPAQEDAANIMRVVAVKNYASNVRVIVQLLQQCNKSHLLNIPTWNWHAGDEIVCFSELKLGFLAQSCLAPGFSTLLTNLFSMRSLHGQEDIAGAAIAIEDVTIATAANTTLAVTPTADGGNADQQDVTETSEKKLHAAAMPSLALRFSENFRKLYNNSLRRNRKGGSGSQGLINLHRLERGLTLSAANAEAMAAANAPWLREYLHGVSMELYSADFSSAFDGMTFAEAAKVCMQRLELMLIAILVQSAEEEGDGSTEHYPYLVINPPSTPHSIIHKGTIGFFICDSQEIASRVTNYCLRCHNDATTVDRIRKCGCKTQGFRERIRNLRDRISAEIGDSSRTSSRMAPTSPASFNQSAFKLFQQSATTPLSPLEVSEVVEKSIKGENGANKIDITGVYYWCPKRYLSCAILPNNHNVESEISEVEASKYLRNHILVCLLVGEKAPRLGLRSFVLPLRASNIPAHELRPIIFLTSHEYIAEEWREMENFPDIYFLPGSPLNRRDLWAARIQLCSVCVVIGVSENNQVDDPYLLDKEAILCSLNIRALKIPPSLRQSVSEEIAARSSGAEIPLLTSLCMDSNIHFLDPDDFETGNADIDIFLTMPFARGLAFTGSVLDALVSTAYFDRNAMTLIRYLVTGGTTPVLEQWAAYGGDFYDNLQITDTGEAQVNEFLATLRRNNTKRPTIAQLSFNDPRLAHILENHSNDAGGITFGSLFCRALEEHGILCLGLFRLNTSSSTLRRVGTSSCSLQRQGSSVRRASACSPPEPVKMRILFEERLDTKPPTETKKLVDRMNLPLGPHSANNRFVITSPPYSFPVHTSDLVFCLIPCL